MSDKQTPAGDERDPVLREYARLAARYDRRWSFYIEATVRETLGRLDAGPGDHVLDVGCGTGALLHALSLLSPATRLAGVDPSPEMLSVARAKVGDSAELCRGRAESLPFAGGTFDVVVSTNVLHYVRRADEALREMRRVLRPGGRLVVTDWCDDFLMCRVLDPVLRLFDRAHFRTYGRAECRRLLEAAGFDPVEVERYRIDWFWGLMTATARKGAG